jgi:hypothetical protein
MLKSERPSSKRYCLIKRIWGFTGKLPQKHATRVVVAAERFQILFGTRQTALCSRVIDANVGNECGVVMLRAGEKK